MTTPGNIVPAHDQKFVHTYIIHYPPHVPRANDSHKRDFDEWKRRRRENGTYHCDFAKDHRNGDESECDLTHPLEAHHKIVEFAMMNEIDFTLLEPDYPGISEETVGAWIDSDANLLLLCQNHHRGAMGVHVASASDFGSTFYIRNLIRTANDLYNTEA